MYGFLTSKKGYTFVEVLIVVLVLGILVAIGVPIFTGGIKMQKVKDCNNQKVVIKSTFQEAMTGMMDNGKSQPKIYFNKIQADHKTTYPGDGKTGNNDDAFVGKECFVLIEDQEISGKLAFTLGDLRGGYRDINVAPEYNDGCQYGTFLKKKKLKDVKFYSYLANYEIPVCPFEDDDHDYHYYIFEDGTVLCSCPDCND